MKQFWERFTAVLPAAMSGPSLSGVAQEADDGPPPPAPREMPSAVPGATPGAVPGATPRAVPGGTPTAAPPLTADVVSIQQDGSTPCQRPEAYPVYEGRIIVGFSPTPVMSRSPRKHAEALLYALVSSGHAGGTILASAMQEFYSECCKVAGLEPYPWQPVATELIDLTGGEKTYGRVRGEKKRVYRIPDQPVAAVVDIEAARKRA